MEKVLFIAYQFPPRGGPGVQRSMAFVSHLREFGYEPIVLTVTEEDIRQGRYQFDESLMGRIPQDILIHRIPANEPAVWAKRMMELKLYRFFWYFGFHRLWEWSLNWNDNAFPVAKQLIREHNIKLVYTSSAPFSVMLLGMKLQQTLNVKWVADLRDPYTDAYAWQFPSKIHWLFRRRFERNVFSKPDRLIVNTPAVKELYLKRQLIEPSKITVITNGY